ncbi:MAG: c-type cytochrome [Deltaproteobacteria bacterium]
MTAVFSTLVAGAAHSMPWSTDMFEQPSVQPYEMPLSNPKHSIPTTGRSAQVKDREKIEAIVENPHKPTEASLKHGEELFGVYCVVCHGTAGKGDGPVIKKGFYPVDLTAPGVQGRTEGYIYGYIRFGGKVMMPSYGESMTSEEAWDVVNYVRKLQGK